MLSFNHKLTSKQYVGKNYYKACVHNKLYNKISLNKILVIKVYFS